MSGIQPVAVYAMRVPPGDILVPAVPEFAAMFHLTMAALDPTAEPEMEDPEDKTPPRATLKVVRVPEHLLDEDDEDDDDDDDEDEDESSDDDEEVNGGPSRKKSKLQKLVEALVAEEDDDEDMADDDDADDEDDDGGEDDEERALKEKMGIVKAIEELQKKGRPSKGKGKAVDGEDESSEDDDEDEAVELDEVVLCTLDPEKHYQQPLDFVVGEGEKIFFKVSGTHTIHLTGNYVIPQDDGHASLYDEDDEDVEDYDLSPDEYELDALDDDDEDEDEESDELDGLADPRITEVHADDEEAPKLIKTAGKGKNKRPAEDSDEEEANLDDIMAKSLKKADAPASAVENGEPKKLSKAEKKNLKKLKKNDGEAVPTTAADAKPTAEAKKEGQVNGTGSEKKVQFAKNLEQGPTPSGTPPASKADKTAASKADKTAASKADKAAADKDKNKAESKKPSLGVRDVQGVAVDDRKIGTGPAAKKGSRLEMRYIGKLESGKVFDSNKSGKPFSFKLGAGEVIKGWDIGMQGIQVGGERRLTIPAHLAYGSKGVPGIPPNSKLIFDIKCLTIK